MQTARKRWAEMETGVAGLAGPARKPPAGVADPASLAAKAAGRLAGDGEALRRCRVKLNAAQRDVAEGAAISHTILGEIENGVAAAGERHAPRVRRTLLRIAAQRLRAAAEVVEELTA